MSGGRFQKIDEPLDGLLLYQLKMLGDHRGSLTRLFCPDELAHTPFADQIAQINLTRTSRKGTVRGLHFQHPPHAEDKFVTCLRGEVLDIVVDLRRGSSTFLHMFRTSLSAQNARAVLVPKGFAHGFQSLTDDVELLYLHSARYAPDAERGLNITDPLLGISLPMPIAERSERDQNFLPLDASFTGVTV